MDDNSAVSKVRSIDVKSFVSDFLGFDRIRVIKTCALVVISGLLEGFGIVLLLPMIEAIGGSASTTGGTGAGISERIFAAFGSIDRLQRIGLVLGLIAIVMIFRALLVSRREIAIAGLELDYLHETRIGLIKRLAEAPWRSVSRLRHSRITHLLGTDVFRIGQAATGLIQSIVASIMLGIQLGIALWLDPLLTMVAIVLLGISAVMATTLIRAARDLGEMVIGANLTLLNDAGQFLGALKLSMSQNLQGRFVGDFDHTLRAITREEVGFIQRQNLIRQRLTIVAAVAGSATAFIGFGIMEIPPAKVVVILLILSRMSAPAAQLQSQMLSLLRSLPAFHQLRVLETELSDGATAKNDVPAPPMGDIVFDHVGYRHPGTAAGEHSAGLDDLSLTIRKGAMFGIGGPSGSGKTTLADLLVGLYDPDKGSITISGEPVKLTNCDAWRERLAYVSQDAFLKNDTIRANLTMAIDVGEEQIWDALELTGAREIVARLPLGLDTVVGERGTLMSGGERQRIAIARGLLRNPDLLILDEATNAIDIVGEAVLLGRLNALRPALTILTIAHRLETLRWCDTMIILADGKVRASGSFEQLRGQLSEQTANQ